jgi:hypothetical protein
MQSTVSTPVLISWRRWVLPALVVAILVGVVASVAPLYLFGAIGSVCLLAILTRGPLTRTAVVLASSLTLLQISSETSVTKLAYLGILIAATGFGAFSLAAHRTRVRAIGGQALLLPAVLIAVVVALSAAVATVHGIALTPWVADVPAYGMLPAAIILGLDLAVSDHQPRAVTLALFLAALGSAMAFAVQWTANHGLVNLNLGRFLLASMFLPAAALCLALAYAFDGRRTYRMAFFATALLFAMLMTATRSAVVFAFPILLTLMVAGGRRRWRLVGLIAGAVVAALALRSVVSLFGAGYFNFELLWLRLGGIVALLSSGGALFDPSLYLRFVQTQALLEGWLREPWFGVGPGAQYTYSSIVDAHPVDSPMAIFARFGVVGVGAFVLLFLTLLTSKLRRGAYWVPATALLTFVGLILAWAVVSSPLDDKGVALGLIPLIGLCGLWRGSRADPLLRVLQR